MAERKESGGGGEKDVHELLLQYLAALFGAATYAGERPLIETFFDQARLKAQSLEYDLRSRILKADGLFLDIVKGIANHDRRRKLTRGELEKAKNTALAVMYRVWFVLYAESRNLLPVRDSRYSKISFQSLHGRLDSYEEDPSGTSCWDSMLALFDGIRDGSPEHNLPKYNGGLFARRADIDLAKVRNRFIVPALRSLLETDGRAVDYGDLGVRHLGSIYESLLEFDVKQAGRDMMLVERSGGVREVHSKAESTYSYKKNDLYLASKGGIASRKTTASFYTPDKIVSFLVGRGLRPLLSKRRAAVAADVLRYKRNPSEDNRRACMDRLLDLQVLDPAMGSGHFLVEALNQITRWATEVLDSHPDHPLAAEIEGDRQVIVEAQAKSGVTIDEGLLTADVLLKRRVMKRCIFGVDVNPLAVDLARLSLWLDSFAIGVPLTYLDHHIKHGDSTIGEWLGRLDDPQDRSLDEWLLDPVQHGGILARVSHRPDITAEQAAGSQRDYAEYERQTRAHRAVLDALTASIIDEGIIPKTGRKERYVRRLARPPDGDKAAIAAKARVDRLAEKYSFFHWDLEMMDAFTDSRRGFDLVVGNPPWEKPKRSDDEFFTPYRPSFRSLRPKTKKAEAANAILEDSDIRKLYDEYCQSFKDKAAFYKTFEMQGNGDKDLWKLVLERMLSLVADDGMISVLLPSQVLANTGAAAMRRRLLDMDIVQAYVFENKKRIFPIFAGWRFLLLTAQNRQDGEDRFSAAFYLHHLSSLEDKSAEADKFTRCSKIAIRNISPVDLAVPEAPKDSYAILEKLSRHKPLGTQSWNGWRIELASCFHATNDSDLFGDKKGDWPVMEGKNMHQFNHAFSAPKFTVDPTSGLRRLEKKKVFAGHCSGFHDSCMIAFRNVARSTDTRTVIAAIIPPRRFYTNSLYNIILKRNYKVVFDDEYNQKIAYLAGVMNSMTFDFLARAKVQMNLAPIMKSIPVPGSSDADGEIAALAARLACSQEGGAEELAALAESAGITPEKMPPAGRIDAAARLDALVAHAYGLTGDEYRTVLESFEFGKGATLLGEDDADWSDNAILKRFYGDVKRAAVPHFDAIARESGQK